MTLIYSLNRGVLHGYSKTDDKHLKEIFRELKVSSDDKIIDIGCGKGNVLRFAYKFPFERIEGIELDGRLVSIAWKNFRILGMDKKIKVSCVDATQYEGYGDFNLF